MSGRSWYPVAMFASQGLLFGVVSFVTTNIGTNPAVASARGMGGLTGPDAAGSVANSGPSFIASITKTANAGEFLVTFADGYRAVWHSEASMHGPAGGPNDGKRACITNASNEGSGRTTALTFLVTTHNENTGAAEETSGRTVSFLVVLKDSGVGA